MVGISSEIVDKVRLFAQSISRDIQVQRIYLFGSYAAGTANNDSDIDILVVSDDFKEMSPVKISSFLFRNAAKIPGDIQPIGYTNEELLNDNNLFLLEVLNHSIEIPLQ